MSDRPLKLKYKRIYIYALSCFALINVAAIFIVFKKYRKDSKNSEIISSTKLKFSKLKEKVSGIEDSMHLQADDIDTAAYHVLNSRLKFLDSVLAKDQISEDHIASITQDIYDLQILSSEIETQMRSETQMLD